LASNSLNLFSPGHSFEWKNMGPLPLQVPYLQINGWVGQYGGHLDCLQLWHSMVLFIGWVGHSMVLFIGWVGHSMVLFFGWVGQYGGHLDCLHQLHSMVLFNGSTITDPPMILFFNFLLMNASSQSKHSFQLNDINHTIYK
jgi:hypothetical protein